MKEKKINLQSEIFDVIMWKMYKTKRHLYWVAFSHNCSWTNNKIESPKKATLQLATCNEYAKTREQRISDV